MTIEVEMPDGSIAEFADGTPDDQIIAALTRRSVTQQTAGVPQQALEAAQQAVTIAPDPAPGQKPLSFGQVISGAVDVAISGARGLVNQPAATAAGLIGLPGFGGGAIAGAIDPTITAREGFQSAQQEARRQIEAGEGIIKSERLRTPEGERVAEFIGRLPVVRHLGQAFETLGGGIERIAGPEVRDVAESAVTLATLRTPKTFRQPAQSTPSEVAVNQAKANGYRVSPTTSVGEGRFAGSQTDRAAAGIAGAEAIDSRIVFANQKITDRLAARAGQLGDDLPSPGNVERSTQRANQAYDNLKALNVEVAFTRDFRDSVLRLGERVEGFPDRPNKQVRQLQETLLKARPTMANVVDKVRELRQNSFKHIASSDPAANQLGHAQRQAANLLDNEIEQYLLRRAERATDPGLKSQLPRLHQEYLKARQELSVLHDIRDSMNPATGSIDAAVLARLAKNHKLHPDLQKIADSFNALGPNSMRNISRAQRAAGIPLQVSSPALVIGALGGTAVGGLGGTAAGMAIASLAPSITRAMAREFALRGQRARRIASASGKSARGAARTAAVGSQVGEGLITEEDLDQ